MAFTRFCGSCHGIYLESDLIWDETNQKYYCGRCWEIVENNRAEDKQSDEQTAAALQSIGEACRALGIGRWELGLSGVVSFLVGQLSVRQPDQAERFRDGFRALGVLPPPIGEE